MLDKIKATMTMEQRCTHLSCLFGPDKLRMGSLNVLVKAHASSFADVTLLLGGIRLILLALSADTCGPILAAFDNVAHESHPSLLYTCRGIWRCPPAMRAADSVVLCKEDREGMGSVWCQWHIILVGMNNKTLGKGRVE